MLDLISDLDSLPAAKALAARGLSGWMDAQADLAKGRVYSRTEEATWTAQERGAKAIQAGATEPAEDVGFVHVLAEARGLTDAQMAASILAKAAGFRAIALIQNGVTDQAIAAIAAAETHAEVRQALTDAQAAYGAALAALMAPA